MLLWVGLAPLSGAVVTEGVVKAEGTRKTVQHQEGGIVKSLLVKEGDRVTAGQALIVLHDVRIDATLDNLIMQADAAYFKSERLRAERDFLDRPVFNTPPHALASDRAMGKAELRARQLAQAETALFNTRRQALNQHIGLLQQQAKEIDQEIDYLGELARIIRKSQELAEETTRLNESLNEQGFISHARWMELRRTDMDARARAESQLAELAKARQKKIELALKAVELRSNYIRAAADELKETDSVIKRLEEEIRPWQDQKLRQTIAAPISGEVLDLRFHGAGAVIGPRDPILDIVPDRTRLIVEARIKPENIKDIHTGSTADLVLTAYRHGSTPPLEGRVTYLGADRLVDKANGQPFYPAHIQVSHEALRKASALAGREVQPSQGMQAEVFIKTRERSPLAYLVDPIVQGIRRSMRER
jgi:HlyD family type I secretion membrane fusion protein